MSQTLPEIITLKAEASPLNGYDNHPIAEINGHVVRIATMSEPYHWHFHPNSDETFLVIEGQLAIDFESGSMQLGPGQMITVPRGVRHRTRPISARSVNLTFELAQSESVAGLILRAQGSRLTKVFGMHHLAEKGQSSIHAFISEFEPDTV